MLKPCYQAPTAYSGCNLGCCSQLCLGQGCPVGGIRRSCPTPRHQAGRCGPAARSRVLSHSSSQRPTSECVRFQPVGSGERRVHVQARTVTALAPPPGTLVLLRGAFRIGSCWGRAKMQSRYFGCVCPTLAPSQITPRGISDRTWNESAASLLGSSRCYNQQRLSSPTAHSQRAGNIKSGRKGAKSQDGHKHWMDMTSATVPQSAC